MKISGILKFGVPVLMMAALVACDNKKEAEMAIEEPAAAPMAQPMEADGASAEGTAEGTAETAGAPAAEGTTQETGG